MEPRNDAAIQIPPPIFIMGCPRTGTTLVSQIIDSHSRMATYHEINYYPVFRPMLRYYGDLRKSSNLTRLLEDLLAHIRMQGEVPPEIEELRQTLVAPTFEGILTTLLYLHARRQGKLRGGEKTPKHYAYLPEILAGFPQSPVVFLMRDPRDTVLSLRKSFGESIDNAIQWWNQAFLSSQRASRPVHLVRYEELVQKPADVVKSMCAFLDEPYEPAMLSFFERIPDQFRNHPNLGRLAGPVDPASVGNFRQMSPSDIGQIEAACAAGMEALGYVATTHPKVVKATAPARPNFFRFALGRLRYHGLNRERWRRSWFRWRMVLRLRARYLLTLGPLRSKGEQVSI